MTWIENIKRWRQLPAEGELLRCWKSIPRDVVQIMAFNKELDGSEVLTTKYSPPTAENAKTSPLLSVT